jgi:hypothetical protein
LYQDGLSKSIAFDELKAKSDDDRNKGNKILKVVPQGGENAGFA